MKLNKLFCLFILSVTFTGISAPVLWADQGQDTSVIKDLSDKVARLENRLQQLEAKPSVEVKTAPVYTPPQSGGVLRAMEDINVSGYVETSYNTNTKSSSSGSLNAFNNRAALNGLHSFDQYQDTFVLNAIKLTLDKPVAETGGIGGRADLMFGEDAKLLNQAVRSSQYSNQLQSIDANGNPRNINDASNVYIEQAYGLLRTPYGNGIDIYFGKFVTLLGVEVIENKDNWNASRGLIFNYGIPFTHTGVRTVYQWNDKFTTYFGVNNGGDQDIDNNRPKSLEGRAVYKLNDKISLTQTAHVGFGSETPTSNQNSSTLDSTGLWPDNNQHQGKTLLILDSIVGLKMTDKWSANVESTYGQNGGGEWYGIGLWNRYEYNDWLAFNHRFEWMNDSSNLRFGAARNDIVGDSGYHVWEMTFGADMKVYKNLLTRLEYRFDQSPAERFGGDLANFSGESQFQSTFLASLIYCF